MEAFGNMPITKILYGEDHPKFQAPVSSPKLPVYPGTKVAVLLPQRCREALLRARKPGLTKGTRSLLQRFSDE